MGGEEEILPLCSWDNSARFLEDWLRLRLRFGFPNNGGNVLFLVVVVRHFERFFFSLFFFFRHFFFFFFFSLRRNIMSGKVVHVGNFFVGTKVDEIFESFKKFGEIEKIDFKIGTALLLLFG